MSAKPGTPGSPGASDKPAKPDAADASPAKATEATAKPGAKASEPATPAKPQAAPSEESEAEVTSPRLTLPVQPLPAKAEQDMPEPEAKPAPKSAESPKDKPEAPDRDERPGTVKVIVGTRRYHSTACPLIRGAGDTGVETMSLARAEAARLTSCSVCQNDRETVS